MNVDVFLETYKGMRPAGVTSWLLPGGDHESKLMIIMSHPSTEVLESGDLLEGANGVELQNALEIAGFKESDYYLTTMIKYWVGPSGKPTTKQIEECSAVLDFEIETVKPKLIITLGAEPFKRLKKENAKVTSFLGNIVDCPYGTKLLPNYSPGMIVTQDPAQRPVFRDVFHLAKRFIEDKLDYTPYENVIVTDCDVNRAIVDAYIREGKFAIGYDAEWKGIKMTDDEVLYTFQYCCEPNTAVTLDISQDGIHENRELLHTMKPLLEHPQAQRMGWNIRADDKRLQLRGFELPEETLYFDGMKAVGFLDSRWPKGLETGIRRFTNYDAYYKRMPDLLKQHKLQYEEMAQLKFLEPEFFYNYCGGDAVSHREACLNMKKEIDKLPVKLRDYWYNVYLPLSNYFKDLELNGIPMDLEKMEELTNMYQGKYNELLAALQDRIATIYPNFNPNSTPDKKALLYDMLKLEPAYYTRKGKVKPRSWYDKQKENVKKQFAPSTNGKSLSTLCFDLEKQIRLTDDTALRNKHAVVKNLLDLGRVGVFANKFLSKQGTAFNPQLSEDEMTDEEGGDAKKSSYWANVCKDGRIHPDFYECLDNFRSSSRPNVQNPASKVLSHIPNIFWPGYSELGKDRQKEIGKMQPPVIPSNIRHIFYGGGPDWLWTENDIAGADLAIAAFLSKDPKYINDILQGNFHLKKAREYFQDPKISKDDYSKYVSAKAITFRVAYTAELLSAALPIQAEIYAESGILIDQPRIEFALQSWENYDKYMDFRAQCLAQVQENKCVVNARGIKYHFEDSEDFRILAGWNNTALAYVIASELALFMWEICIGLKKHFQKDKVWMKYVFPVNSVHDAAYHIIHKDLMKDNYFPEITKYYFSKQCKIVTGDNLGMEMSVGDRWKAKNEVFHGETVWDFTNKCWNWKK